NPDDVYFMRRAVGDWGGNIQLSIVPDGDEALAFLRQAPPFTSVPTPALILLDLELPTMHGTQVLTEIRHLPAYQAIPIVIVSGEDKAVEELRCLQLGATAYVE